MSSPFSILARSRYLRRLRIERPEQIGTMYYTLVSQPSSPAAKRSIRLGAEHGAQRYPPNVSINCLMELFADLISLLSAINTYLPRIQRHVDKLVKLIEGHGKKPVLLNDVMAWFAFDSMGDFMFNESFGMMDSTQWHKAIIQQKGALRFLAPLNDTIWIVHMALSMFPFVGMVRDWNAMVRFCDHASQRRMNVSRYSALD